MMNRYICKDGDRLDTIIYNHYKDLSVFNAVMSANPHLLGKVELSIGDVVYLPEITQSIKEIKGVSLWS